jgi:hypothetical protein
MRGTSDHFECRSTNSYGHNIDQKNKARIMKLALISMAGVSPLPARRVGLRCKLHDLFRRLNETKKH